MWLYDEKEVCDEALEGFYGFIYEITNTTNGRKYLGRKFLTRAGRKQVKGKIKKFRVESDWRNYYGSSDELLKDIALLGKDCFERRIVRFCKTIGECKYQETKYQFLANVLEEKFEDGTWAYYNGNIAMKFHRKNIGNK